MRQLTVFLTTCNFIFKLVTRNSCLIYSLNKDTCPVWFYFMLLVCAQFFNEIGKCQLYKSHWNMNIFVFYNQWKIMWHLNIFHEKNSYFVSIPLFGFTLVIKLRNSILKVIGILYYFCDKKGMVSDLNMSHGKLSFSSPLFEFTLVIKLRNFNFEG